MKPSTVLKKARKLIEKGWCKGTCAQDATGAPIDPQSRKAVSWCAMGAIIRASKREYSKADHYLERATPSPYTIFNDYARDRRTVLRAFDRAIKLAISEGK